MMYESSVSTWIAQLGQENGDAAQKIWERYYQRLVALAAKKLSGARRRAADEEDVVQEAFDAFFRAAAEGRFPQLRDRNNLWQILVRITENRAFNQRKHEHREKRGGGRVRGHSAFAADNGSQDKNLGQIAGREPSPEFAAHAREECGRLLALLGEEQLQQVALLKMAGYSRREIAERLGCVPDTISRKLRLIQSIWSEDEQIIG